MELLGQKIQGFQLADVSVSTLKMLIYHCIPTYSVCKCVFPTPPLDFINCALFFPLCLLCFFKS